MTFQKIKQTVIIENMLKNSIVKFLTEKYFTLNKIFYKIKLIFWHKNVFENNET